MYTESKSAEPRGARFACAICAASVFVARSAMASLFWLIAVSAEVILPSASVTSWPISDSESVVVCLNVA